MKYTNRLNLPEIFKSLFKDKEIIITENRYSVTEILGSVQQIILHRRYANQINKDISECVPTLIGTAVHEYLEKNAPKNSLSEIKFEVNLFGKTLVGICDSLDLVNQEIIDYKTTTVSQVSKGDFDGYYKQDMMYALMTYIKYGAKIKKLKNYILMKDWSKLKSVMSSNYPKSPIYVWEYEVQDSDYDNILDFINKKFKEIDEGIKDCTNDEKWYTGDKYAVYQKQSDKRAKKVFDTQEEAEQFKTNNNCEHIEPRYGDNLKCTYYCDVKQFCDQYRKENV